MRQIGFSTGSLACGNFLAALRILRNTSVQAVELSALRFEELRPLVEALDTLDLSQFSYVSLHAPSNLTPRQEEETIRALQKVVVRNWPIILHTDAVNDFSLWRPFGRQIAVENMDKRKQGTRTVDELQQTLIELPQASVCFDLGHSRQVDRTMTDAYFSLRKFRTRIVQVHISDVTVASRHEALNWGAVESFRRVAAWIPPNVPVILETVVDQPKVNLQLKMARQALLPELLPA